ncbi:MAG: homoserine O-acetyltransferase/O-succinyltransferase family protein [Acidimicrobiales bacterium]
MTVTAARGRWGATAVAADPPIEVALVNNMPDAAFAETERQFLRLVQAGSAERRVTVRLSAVPEPGRGEEVQRILADRYERLEVLYRSPPDAVVVTGSEPRHADLREEVTWRDLSELCRWSVRSTSAVAFSCLASHCALLADEGIERRRLAAKLSGVYVQAVGAHPLVAGLGPVVPCPHSRLHDVPARTIEEHGYSVALAAPASGWSVAVRDGACLTMLLQGHPEYAPTTLLREYRRDVRRYLSGEMASYPRVPAGYLDVEGVALLDRFRDAVTGGRPDAASLERFPFAACADRIAADWQAPMEHLFANWLAQVGERKLRRTLRRAG